ncbi:epoxide hydrolase 3-like isoform X2 [Pomacea canaliculata]|uniref:epoxide hydrolase 3-like isoform X2 n=1 Tax=Pomacea canaliculata TaxID=400727 RepID=UPI000D736EFF|nr:epoxide hydrolase 3-like isoform X2 [Pomacea canaliculata]
MDMPIWRVVAVDQRGYGDSDKPSSVYDYRLPMLVNDLKELIIALDYKKCVLVGHDWGGIVAWAFAQTVPDMVEHLIVMNAPSPHAFLNHASNSLSQLKKSWYFFFFQVPYIPELIISLLDFDFLSNAFTGKTMGVRSGSVTEDDVEAYKFTFQRNGLTAPINFYRGLVRYPDFAFSRLQSLQSKVMCPTLIIWGCKDGALEKELAALSTEMVAGEVTVKYIEDCSHWTQMDRPEQVNTFIHEFLKQN